MALPPIITNSPIFKALTGAQNRPAPGVAERPPSAPSARAGDSVTLSDEALQKLEADRAAQTTARTTASAVRADLERDPVLTLGIDDSAL